MIFLYSLAVYAILIIIILAFVKAETILDVSFWFFVSFAFLILAHFTSGVEFLNITFVEIIPIIFSYLVCIFIGNMIGKKLPEININSIFSIKLRTLSVLCIIGALITFADLALHNQINFGRRIQGMQISAIGVIGSILSFNGLIPILYVLISFFKKNSKVSLLGIVAGCSYVTYGILTGGRQSLFILIITFLILLFFCYKKYRFEYFIANIKKYKLFLLIFFTVFSAFFVKYITAISKERGAFNLYAYKLMHFHYVTGVNYSQQSLDAIKFMDENIGMGLGMTEFLFYYSHELYTYNVLYHNYSESPAFVSQLHYFCRRIPFLNEKFENVCVAFEQTLEAQGLFGHTWGTGFQNFLIDYGRGGMYVMLFLLGLFAGCNWKIMKKSYSSQAIIRQGLLCVAAVFSIQFSALCEYSWCWPFFTVLFFRIKDEGM